MKALAVGFLAAGYTAMGFGFTWAAANENGPQAALCMGGLFLIGAAGLAAIKAHPEC